MTSDVSSCSIDSEKKNLTNSFALRLGEGLEFAEFEPAHWRLTVFHVLGVSRHVSMGYAEVFLLDYFAKHPGKMLSRQELLDHAWQNRVVSQGSLNQAISNLRSLLGDDQKQEIIITVPRRGYQFNEEVLVDWQEWLVRKSEILSPTVIPPVPPINPLSKVNYRRWKIPVLLSVLGLCFLVLVGSLYNYQSTVFPYVSKEAKTANTQIILLAKNKAELDETHVLLLPILERMDAMGGGRALVRRTDNFLEFSCFHADGTVHSFLAYTEWFASLDDSYLRRCLK